MKQKIKILFVPAVILSAILAAKTANADLVAYYKLEETRGRIVSDSSDYDNHGTLQGSAAFSTKGDDGIRSLCLNGKDNYVEIPHSSSLDITENVSVAAWIKVNKFDKKWQAIVSKGDTTWRIARNGYTDSIRFDCDVMTNMKRNPRGVPGRIGVNDARWHHIVGTYDGRLIALYVDGVFDNATEAAGPIYTNNYPVMIGENKQKGQRFWDGLIDEVAIFDHALSSSEVLQLYLQGIESFTGSIENLVEGIKAEIKDLKPKEAIQFLERKIVKINQPTHSRLPTTPPLCPDLYYLLGKAKAFGGAPSEDVIDAYKKSISRLDLRTQYAPRVLLWFFENMSRDDYVDIIQDSLQSIKEPSRNICLIARDFESSENWPAFEIFLDTVFSTVNDKGFYAVFINKGLTGKGAWAARFSQYCRSKPELTECLFYQDEKIARRHIAQQDFRKAINIYRDIVSRCGSNQDKSAFEYKICECLFSDGQIENAITEVGNFIQKYKVTNRYRVKKAMFLQGQAYVQTEKIEQAADTFFTLMMEYPESEQAVAASYFTGYCLMMQGKFPEAAEAFQIILKEYPESKYADNAQKCLVQIKQLQ